MPSQESWDLTSSLSDRLGKPTYDSSYIPTAIESYRDHLFRKAAETQLSTQLTPDQWAKNELGGAVRAWGHNRLALAAVRAECIVPRYMGTRETPAKPGRGWHELPAVPIRPFFFSERPCATVRKSRDHRRQNSSSTSSTQARTCSTTTTTQRRWPQLKAPSYSTSLRRFYRFTHMTKAFCPSC